MLNGNEISNEELRRSVYEKIKECVAEMIGDDYEIDYSDGIISDLDLDSLDRAALIVGIENSFNVSLDYQLYDDVELGQIVDDVEMQLSK